MQKCCNNCQFGNENKSPAVTPDFLIALLKRMKINAIILTKEIKMQNELLHELEQRGFINQTSNLDALNDALNNGPICAYMGSDPTADSLHVGHLVPVMMMRWLQKYGHKPLMLVGGATGRIGDPSGRDTGRPMMTEEQRQKNVKMIKEQMSKSIFAFL